MSVGSAGRTSGGKSEDHRGISPDDKLFLKCFLVFVTVFGFMLLILSAFFDGILPMGISLTFGLAAATLNYGFLGSNHADQITWKSIRFGGAAAVLAGVVLLTNPHFDAQMARRADFNRLKAELKADKQTAVNRLNTELADAEERINLNTIVQARQRVTIIGGGHVTPENVNTLNSPYEGHFDPRTNRFQSRNRTHFSDTHGQDSDHIFDSIIGIVTITDRTRQQLMNMSEQQWADYLREMDLQRRERITLTPFARLIIESSDNQVQRRTVFRGEEIPVLNQEGRPEAYLCIQRVLDTRINSEEPEVVVFNHSRRHCVS
jgi:hypothetical protein